MQDGTLSEKCEKFVRCESRDRRNSFVISRTGGWKEGEVPRLEKLAVWNFEFIFGPVSHTV